jgi:hypothetical protein
LSGDSVAGDVVDPGDFERDGDGDGDRDEDEGGDSGWGRGGGAGRLMTPRDRSDAHTSRGRGKNMRATGSSVTGRRRVFSRCMRASSCWVSGASAPRAMVE